jgi:hypothetical protein
MATLSAEQAASHLYDAGFREPDLSKMVAIGHRESRYKTDAHRTDQDKSKLSGDRGLFQINYIHDKNLMQAGIINGKSDLMDPAKNAAAAFYLYKQGGLQPWAAGPGGWQGNGDPLYGTDYGKAQTATKNYLANPQQYGSRAPGGTSQPETQVAEPSTAVRDTTYDPTYEPPVVDPEAQKGLTDMLSRFGIDYPDAPRATPQLLAFMRGLGMSYDTAEDVARQQTQKIEGRSADSMEDIERGDQRKRRNITNTQQSRGALSSGATNTKYAERAEDKLASQADVARRKAEGIADTSSELAMRQDALRQDANERIISEEEKQAVADALAQEQVRDFKARQAEADFQAERNSEAQRKAEQASIDRLNNQGLGVN